MFWLSKQRNLIFTVYTIQLKEHLAYRVRTVSIDNINTSTEQTLQYTRLHNWELEHCYFTLLAILLKLLRKLFMIMRLSDSTELVRFQSDSSLSWLAYCKTNIYSFSIVKMNKLSCCSARIKNQLFKCRKAWTYRLWLKFIDVYTYCGYYYSNTWFGAGGGSGGVRQIENLIKMKRALLLPRPTSIANWNVKVPKRPTTIKNNICRFKKLHYMQLLVFHGEFSVKRYELIGLFVIRYWGKGRVR